jgi:DNA mismatch repair protein MSH6
MAKSEKSTTTPSRPAPARKQASSAAPSTSKNQRSILGFFSKAPTAGLPLLKKQASPPATLEGAQTDGPTAAKAPAGKAVGKVGKGVKKMDRTPVASSDVIEPPSSEGGVDKNGGLQSSPSRRAKKPVSYQEPDEDDEDDEAPVASRRSKSKKKVIESDDDDDEDVFVGEVDEESDDDGEFSRRAFRSEIDADVNQ